MSKKGFRLIGLVLVVGLLFGLPFQSVSAEPGTVGAALQLGSDRLTELQNTDGGWDWPLDDGNPAAGSALNTLGPIAKGLAQAYNHTADADHLAALSEVATLFLTKTTFATSDGYLAAQLDAILGGTTYSSYIKTYFYDKLVNGSYVRAGVTYNTESYIAFLRGARSGLSANLAAWDLGLGLVSAASCGVNGQELGYWIDGVKAEINELDDYTDSGEEMWYFAEGLAGSLYGLAYVNQSIDPTAGYFSTADDISDLFESLGSFQINNGGVAWHPDYVIPDDQNESTQATAYAILAFDKFNRSNYLSNIQGAADYLLDTQASTGGWDETDENNEVTGEVLWALSLAYPEVWVCPGADCGHTGFQYSSIQTAVNAVVEGGIVNVAAGTYDEENIVISKGLSLIGAGRDVTHIAPSVVTNNNTISVNNPTGNVLIQGFDFVMQPKSNYGSAVGVFGTAIAVDSATVTIDSNKVTGSDNGAKSDYGFYGQGNNAKLVITNNVISKTGDNPVVMENQMGSTTFANNTVYITSSPDYNPYFSMVYAGNTVSTPQIVRGNTFNLDHSGAGYSEAVTFDTAVLNSWNGISTDSGHYTNILVENNTIVTGGAYARGVALVDLSAAKGLGTITGAVIQNNQMIGESVEDASTYGITLRGDVTGSQIKNNTISNVNIGVWVRPGVGTAAVCPSANEISTNKFSPVKVSAQNDCTTGSVDVSENWWGSASGPAVNSFVGSAVYIPWCANEGCTLLGYPPVHNVTQDTYFYAIQAAIDAAAAGDVIEIREGTYAENVNVNKGVTLRGDGSRFTNPLQTGESPAEGVWYPDRYRPAVFEIATFGGETVIKHGVRSTDSETSRPSPYNSSFYNTQGRKYDVNLAGPTQTVTIDMFVGADWASNQRNPGLWATGFDGADISAYPILAWRSTTGVVPGFYAFDYINGGWLELRKATPADYNVWHTLKIVLNVGTGVDYYVDGQKLLSFADPDTKTIGNLILNVYNFGSDYDVYWKNLLAQAAPATVTGLMTISASNVTVEGLTLTNPGGSYGVYVNPGIAHINILNNVITNIGGSTTTANVKGIYLLNGPDDIRIEGNTFQNLQASGKSVNGVYAGDSNATDPVVGITIRANLFTAISSDTKGGYGILFNNLAGTQNVLITLNTFDQISGGWTHAIGLEGPTPGALVTGNTFKNLFASDLDLTAVFFEDNPVGGTAKLENNMFMNAGFGAAIHPKHAPYTYVVDASPNYWGSSCGPVAAHAMAGENVEFYPWYTDDGMTSQSAPASYTITSGMSAVEINAVLTCAAPGSTITFGIGNHPGNLVIPAGREHLTLVLQNGAVINASSPCFNVQADFTTIKAQNIGMASCVTVAGSNGIDVAAGLRNLTVDGLEITGAGNDGIHFAGAITDVVLKDNFIHDLVGNGVYFGGQPIALTTGGIDIHGNLFQNNTGKGIEADTFTVPAEYNSWGSASGAAAGDGISNNVDADPFTHVDVYMTASGTPWTGIPLNQVQIGQTITFTVKAHVVNALTVDVKLAYPTNLINPVANLSASAFSAFAEFDTHAPANTIWFHGMAPYVSESGYLPITGDVELFKVTFTGGSAGLALPMNLDETSDMFGMAAAGSSANIYAAALTDSTVNVIALPTIDIVPLLTGPYTAGLPIEFNLTVSNTGGGNFSDLHLDWTIPTGAVLQYWDGDSWEAVSDPLDIGTLAAGATAFDAALPQFRITFMYPPSGTLSVSLLDLQPAGGFQLAVTSETFPLAGNFTVTGTFSMQGRSTRAGIPVALDYQGLVGYSDLSGTTIDQISLNLVIANVNGGSWLLTTNQPRYLNVTAELGKLVSVVGNVTLPPLQLKGGNAVWTDNVIDVNDASKVGNTFGDTTALAGDCNFDGIVNVQDLAMVGGNYDLNSQLAYGSWTVQ